MATAFFASPAFADSASTGQTPTPSQLAAQTGQPVVVDADTTETSQVVANPDGTFTLTSDLTPVRVQHNGTWVPVDATLQQQSDGTYKPAASAADVTFSGGGSGPMLTIANGDASVAFTWPSPLPTPTVSGATATYPSVLPGVDLQLTATSDSFSEVLVVQDANAAANPALSDLQIQATATGVTLSKQSDGSLVGTDPNGNVLFQGSAPTMWDSSDNPQVGPAPTSTNPGGAATNVIPMQVAAAQPGAQDDSTDSTITLTPPVSALTGSDVQYPVYIDPTLTDPWRAHFAVVFSNGWHYYDDTSNDLKVGDCDWPGCDGIGVGRTYLNFDTTALNDEPTTAQVSSAYLQVYEIHNAGDCTAEDVDLYGAGSFSSSTTWPGPIGSTLYDEESSNAGDSCSSNPAANVDFYGLVEQDAQNAATYNYSSLNFTLKAPDESNADQWKRFDSDADEDVSEAKLVVNYAYPPSTPGTLHVADSVVCPGKPVYTSDETPEMYATATDYNTPTENLEYWFLLTRVSTGVVVRANQTAPWVASGSAGSFTTSASNSNNTNPLPQDSYTYDVYANNTSDADSAYSSSYAFTIDATPPSVPSISSLDYPEGAWGSDQSHPGAMTFTSSSDAAGFAYAFDGHSAPSLSGVCSYTTTPTTSGGLISASGGAATLTLPTGLSAGYHTVTVQAFDDAHNLSGDSDTYSFYVAPSYAGEGTTVLQAESLAFTNSASLTTSVVTGSQYDSGAAMQLNADSNSATSPEDFVVTNPADASESFCNGTISGSSCTGGVEGDYAIGLAYARGTDLGIAEIAVDGTLLSLNGTPIRAGGYAASAEEDYVMFGGIHLTAGWHKLSIDVVGKNASSTGYAFIADYIRLAALNDTTVTSYDTARNNHAVTNGSAAANAGPSTANIGLTSTSGTLVYQLFNGGYTTSDGATFTLNSTPAADGSDNVIADGQSIQLPTYTGTPSDVDLLVFSTCGSTVDASTRTELRFNYASGSPTSSTLVSVPDTTTAAETGGESGTSSTLVYVGSNPYDDGTTSAGNAQIYELQVPIGGTDPTSITLPNYGGDFTNDCTSPNLHILGITTT